MNAAECACSLLRTRQCTALPRTLCPGCCADTPRAQLAHGFVPKLSMLARVQCNALQPMQLCCPLPTPLVSTRELKHKQMVSAAMARHGLKSVSSAKARRLAEAAEEEAAETLELEAARANAHEASVDPGQLAGARATGVPGNAWGWGDRQLQCVCVRWAGGCRQGPGHRGQWVQQRHQLACVRRPGRGNHH